MRIIQILNLLLLTVILSSCWSLHIKDEAPASLGNTDLLESLIGQKSESVIRELGLPNELLSDGDKQFMVYSARSSDNALLMFGWIPMLVPAAEGPYNVLHCLRFELDSDNVVKEYRVKSKVMQRLVLIYDIEFYSSCREVFWSKQELTKLQITKYFPPEWVEIEKQLEAEGYTRKERMLKKQAEKGNADARLTLFRYLSEKKPEESLVWLCRSADSGNQDARLTLAKIYEFAGDNWIKEGIVERDDKLAYVWYALSRLYDQEDLQFFADRYLTAAELSEVKNMLREWQPGQCERDLGLVSYTE